MSLVNVLNVQVLDNPSRFTDPFKFEITFECLAPLEQDLEWKIIYVGSAESERYDQVLDCIMVGPISVGINKFVFQADPPNPTMIPANEMVGVTVVLLPCSYMDQEFVRIGYYVDNNYEDPELRENPPMPPKLDILKRSILSDKPRVTHFDIKWDSNKTEEIPRELLDLQVEEEQEESENESESESGSSISDQDSNQSFSLESESEVEEEEEHPSSSLMDVDPVPSNPFSLSVSPVNQMNQDHKDNQHHDAVKFHNAIDMNKAAMHSQPFTEMYQ